MDNVKRNLSWKFIIFEVLFLGPSTHAWYSGADHYWPLNEIGYSRVYDHVGSKRWTGTIKGDAEIAWCPPQLALDLYGEDAWVNLGLRYNSCYIDVEYCNQTGLTIAFWVAFHEANTMQGLIEFGRGECGLSIIRTNDNEINATLRSVGLGSTWSVESVNASLGKGTWHHVTLTWNSTGEVNLFINGTRLEDAHQEVTSNVSCSDANCTCNWSMKVGTMTQLNSSVQSYSSVKLARLVLWHYALTNDTILRVSNDVNGLYFLRKGCYGSSWVVNLQFCYNIHPEGKKTWYEARKTCQKHSGNLVSIGSQEEYDFLEEAFRKKNVSSCLHIGLQNNTGNCHPSWVDGNVWRFSKLNSSYEPEDTEGCVYRGVDGLWYFSNCNEKCGFVCKKYRAGLFRNAEFHCRIRRHDHQLVNHRLAIGWVQNELACAIDCLIYGSGCKSYNYKQNYELPSNGQNICELSGSNQHKRPASLIHSIGYQYCERVS